MFSGHGEHKARYAIKCALGSEATVKTATEGPVDLPRTPALRTPGFYTGVTVYPRNAQVQRKHRCEEVTAPLHFHSRCHLHTRQGKVE